MLLVVGIERGRQLIAISSANYLNLLNDGDAQSCLLAWQQVSKPERHGVFLLLACLTKDRGVPCCHRVIILLFGFLFFLNLSLYDLVANHCNELGHGRSLSERELEGRFNWVLFAAVDVGHLHIQIRDRTIDGTLDVYAFQRH